MSVPRVAVAGLGGFAGEHHAALAQLESEGRCRVVATCDPDPAVAAAGVERFGLDARRVAVFPDLARLLASERVDLVALPTPIPLHAEGHRLAVDAGAACYLEKPPSLWWPEFQAMRDVERRAAKATQVGFNFVGDPFRRRLKARILANEFGALRHAGLQAVWPRDAAYYGRNDWAGRLRAGDRWVLDSPLGNALAHYVQNLLFWGGTGDVDAVGELHSVRAWLARTRPLETYDTALVEATLATGATLRFGVTHAPLGPVYDRETLVFERARFVFDRWNLVRIEHADGRVETVESETRDGGAMLRHNLAETLAYVEGERARPTTRLEDSASFVALCDLAFVSSNAIHQAEVPDLAAFVEEGRWPDAEPARVAVDDLARLPDVVHSLLRRQGT